MARQLDEQLAARFPPGQQLRVLDVGMGLGTQALRLARAGHTVTGLEDDPALLAAAREALTAEPPGVRQRMRIVEGDGRDTGVHFLPGSFDVVLCHGVLMSVPEPDPLLAGLARMLAPGGLLSLVVRNGDASAFGPGLRGDWAGALAALDAGVRLPGPRTGADDEPDTVASPAQPPGEGRADRLADLTATLAGIGAPLQAWYGVRVFTDAVHPQRPEPDAGLPVDVGMLLAVEERAGRTDPYRAVATLLHLCGVRG
ncbi:MULTISPECIES: class I SAM-dependent methyltransferase [Streptomyces]|uniref:Class I SAM-dependent methyltransferase n=1 Tax=Streptomyces thermoviolaceus subsp. thermoviolaceus TaxID=66860 RepID=A0ABX0YS67_STRTL|nr:MULTISPECIES: class I SAM-dependent methyltransferase [Streptomyces]MCM3264379.1 class I SAM-dependent methyltransferase [Streptomyces thermoviolaceus]NJP13905.1 class I SAM-dependent methyltransferase [Streptomyces thermoviolaceus subsp. thermoviolaceus]RSR97555.1 class I SAM-dependent methyltransferase [Streptomyces sp. WAC00469]WTD49521.1 class I SAM-dependent methyltransferase [Streptomyces thermoviolaceus]GGV61608.1 methyltransferase [Streptomyces thermoviolaceus subsp. apingens]